MNLLDDAPFESLRDLSRGENYPDENIDREILMLSQSASRAFALFTSVLLFNFVSPALFGLVMMFTWPNTDFGLGYVAICSGFVISQFAGIWLWLRSYAPSFLNRFIQGTLLSLVTTLTAIWPLVFFSALRISPVEIFFCMTVGVLFYWVQGLAISGMLKLFKCSLGKTGRPGNQYSIRWLLGAMTAVAALSLVGKNLAQFVSKESSGANPVLLESTGEMMLWLAWIIPWTSLLANMQLGARFSYAHRYYQIAWWIVMLIGPTLYAMGGSMMSNYFWKFSNAVGIREILLSYAVELGFVLGLSLVMGLLPSQRSLDAQEIL